MQAHERVLLSGKFIIKDIWDLRDFVFWVKYYFDIKYDAEINPIKKY